MGYNERNLFTVIIADDETAMLSVIKSHLSEFPEISIIATTVTGEDTLKKARKLKPDAMFLDVEMPQVHGLSVAEHLRQELPDLKIVFITDFTQYAAQAFELGAIDYLVKPITSEAINRGVARIKDALSFDQFKSSVKNSPISKLLISNSHEVFFINPDDIIFIEKFDRKTCVHLQNCSYTTTETLNSIAQRLNGIFFRCHKSFLINMDKIEKIRPIAERTYEIHFHNFDKTATMTRKKLEEFYSLLK